MFKQLMLVIGGALTATLVACGGGGDSGGAPSRDGSEFSNGENISYITFNGLKWSSPSNATYVNSTFSTTLDPTASAYCSRTTSTNGGPTVATNFNRETGWSIPTNAQMSAFRLANPSPVGWSNVAIWIDSSSAFPPFDSTQTYITYGTGIVTLTNNASSKAHVVCVKRI